MEFLTEEPSYTEGSNSSRRSKASERGSRWYRENKEKVDARVKQRKAQDPKHFAAIKAAYYRRNKQKWQGYKVSAYRRRRTDFQARARHMVAWLRLEAGRKEVPFDLTVEWVRERLERGVCEVTGLKLDITDEHRAGRRISPYAPSVDRLSGPAGYLRTNCRMVVWIYNLAKQNWSDTEVLTMARALVAKVAS